MVHFCRCKAEFFYVSYGDTELEAVEGSSKMVGSGPGRRLLE